MAVHLYGVTGADGPAATGTGRRDAPIRVVADEELAVIVSDVDEQAKASAKDLMAHTRVLESFVENATVVPMQFGIMLPDDEAVRREVLERDHDLLLRLLHLFDGVVQVSVRARHDEEPALREVFKREPALKQLRDAVRQQGATSVLQVGLGEAVSEALERLSVEDADVILNRLDPEALAVTTADSPGVHEVVNAAFLVDRSKRERFDHAVAELREQFGGRVLLRYVGPQPPYSFLDEAVNGGLLRWD